MLVVLLLVLVVQGAARRRPCLYARLFCPRGMVYSIVRAKNHLQYSFEVLDGGAREVAACLNGKHRRGLPS